MSDTPSPPPSSRRSSGPPGSGRRPAFLQAECRTADAASFEVNVTSLGVSSALVELRADDERGRLPLLGSSIVLCVQTEGFGELLLPGKVRWTSDKGFGMHFDLLGIRETRALVRLVPRASATAV